MDGISAIGAGGALDSTVFEAAVAANVGASEAALAASIAALSSGEVGGTVDASA